MNKLHRLLNLPARLTVWRIPSGEICVEYENCEISDGGGGLISDFGRGWTFDEAVDSYFAKISGKTLVFNACTDRREEVRVL